MASMKPHTKSILLSFLLLTLSQYPTSSSPTKLSYIDHCDSVVPHATVTGSIDPTTYISLYNGYISGGDELLEPDQHPSPEAAPSISLPGYFYFYSQNLRMTRTLGVIKFEGSLHLEGPTYTNSSNHHRRRNNVTSARFNSRKIIDFALSGFWSKPSGKICMVGSGFITTKQGTSLKAIVVFKLNYPHVSDISTSLVNGTLESLDTKDSPSHFEPISVLAYAQNNYSYSKISQAKFACSHFDVHEELLGFGDSYSSTSTCNYVQSFFNVRFMLEYGKACSILNCTLLGFEPTFMVFNQFGCAEDGKVHMYIGFPIERNYDFRSELDKSFVGEGFWDPEKKRFCLVAFPILIRKNSPLDASVGNAAFGISLWFPGVMSIESRSTVVGRIWHEKATSRYMSFQSSNTNTGFLGGMRYVYTSTQFVTKYCESNGVGKLGTGRYPDGNIIGDLRFDIILTNHEGFSFWGSANPFSLGEKFYGDSYEAPNTGIGFETTLEEMTPVLSNVSYKLTYRFFNKLSEVNTVVYISAEGIYNAGTGTICMVGCRDQSKPDQYRNSNGFPMDCNILINIQLAPMNPGEENVTYPVTRHLNGTIQSTRTKEDPLYFEPLNISSSNMYASEAIQETRRMDIEIIMVLISLTFLCIFIALQLFHIKRHPEVLPSVSITMLVVLTLGLVTPLVLNFEALFMNRNRQNVLLRSGGWIEVNEVIVRLMTLLAFLLQFRLLQSAWNARSSGDNKKSVWVAERKALGFCLILYFCGALIDWFVHKSSYQTPLEGPVFVEERTERNNHSIWEDLMSYAGLLLDGFLLPQIVFNMIGHCTDKALLPFYYVGITVVRALPHLYDTYRAHYYMPPMDSSIIFARSNENLYSSALNFIIPLQGVLFALLIFFQQKLVVAASFQRDSEIWAVMRWFRWRFLSFLWRT